MPNRTSSTSAADWYLQWRGLVWKALSKRLSRREDKEDLAQEIYLRLLRVKNQESIDSPQAYLYRVAINVVTEWRQLSQQSCEHSASLLKGLLAESSASEDTYLHHRDQEVQRSLKSLPLNIRTAVVLHVAQGKKYKEIAAHMGLSERAVKRYIATGYASLRGSLGNFSEEYGPLQKIGSSERDK